MNSNPSDNKEFASIEQAAAEWTVRIDRGLSATEQDQYTEWLAKSPKHREAIAEYQWGWDEFDRLAGLQSSRRARVDPDLLSGTHTLRDKISCIPRRFFWAASIPLAALLLLSFFLYSSRHRPAEFPVKPATELMARIEKQVLEDGSVVQLNRGTAIDIAYSATERRVRLLKGEASFDVVKDPHRPFVVRVGEIDVRVTGTIFNVNFKDTEVDVVVTEGSVGVVHNKPSKDPATSFREVVLRDGQRGKINFTDAEEIQEIEVTELSQSDLEQVKRWQPKLLDYDSAPLKEIVEEFNRRNPIQIVLGDSSIGELRLSSSFWSDNVEGFVHLMVSSFDMEAEWRGSREIVLYKNSR